MKYESDEFVIDYPSNWILDDSGLMNSKLFLFSPLESAEDQFRENVNIMSQDISAYNIDLDMYVKISENEIKTLATNSKILESKRLKKEDREYHKIIYQADQGIFTVQFEQYYLISSNNVIIVTLTCEKEQFQTYQALGEQILNSFEWKFIEGTAQAIESIIPFEIELGGVLREIEDVESSVPPIRLFVNQDSIEVVVGRTEKYSTLLEKTEFPKLIPYLVLDDFKGNQHYYNSELPYGGLIRLHKEIDGVKYEKTVTNFMRSDVEIAYLEMDSIDIFKSYHLSRIANGVALPFIKDDVVKEDMIIAKSIKEALQNPEKVYELNLRNTRTNHLSSNIRKLKNLRVLDISGSFIPFIPPEIEDCKHLKVILANASQLSQVPPSLGKLKYLRVLNLASCKIKTIPPELGNLSSLWSINLDSNQLETIPNSFSNLKNVTFFSVADNELEEFPLAILGMESVGNLWMHGNPIKRIPLEIREMPSLHHFLLTKSTIVNLTELEAAIPDVRIINY
ncbi:MAG: leucine-rich repeat domain-containing protein [Bacteroidota bacterium]